MIEIEPCALAAFIVSGFTFGLVVAQFILLRGR